MTRAAETSLCRAAEAAWDAEYEGIKRRPKEMEFTYKYVRYIARFKIFRMYHGDYETHVEVRTRTGRPVAFGWT